MVLGAPVSHLFSQQPPRLQQSSWDVSFPSAASDLCPYLRCITRSLLTARPWAPAGLVDEGSRLHSLRATRRGARLPGQASREEQAHALSGGPRLGSNARSQKPESGKCPPDPIPSVFLQGSPAIQTLLHLGAAVSFQSVPPLYLAAPSAQAACTCLQGITVSCLP